MMATLIGGRKPRVLHGIENAPCIRTFQYRSEPSGLRNPQTSAQLLGIDPGLHNGVGRRRWQSAVRKSFVGSTDVVSAATSPRSTIEITCNHVNLLRNHDSTDGEDELLGGAFLLGVDDADM